MGGNLGPKDREEAKRLAAVRQRNNDALWLLCDYLNDSPRTITREMVASLGEELPEEAAYAALLAGVCGLDLEADPGRELTRGYIRPAVRKLDRQAYLENPYYRDIRIPEVRFGEWELRYESYAPYEAFICDDISLAEDEDFKEIPRVGFFDEEFRFPAVMEGKREWMAIKPNEIETMRPALAASRGQVVTFGLGLGYFAYMASLKEEVERVTVIERDPEVIALFERHILPQFRCREKVEVLSADAFEYAQMQMPERAFDLAFVDLWHDASDGLPLYLQMKRLERLSPETRFLYWIEESLLSSLRWHLFERVVERSGSAAEIRRCLSDAFLRDFAAARARLPS